MMAAIKDFPDRGVPLSMTIFPRASCERITSAFVLMDLSKSDHECRQVFAPHLNDTTMANHRPSGYEVDGTPFKYR